MGWLYFQKPPSIKQWFEELLSGERREYIEGRPWGECPLLATHKCLASSVGLKVAYAAVERTPVNGDPVEVFAVIFLLGYAPKEHFDFGYKDMTEHDGPYYHECPERILKLLTPTDNEYALKWRAACRAHNARYRPHAGDKVTFPPATWPGRGTFSSATVVDAKRRVIALPFGNGRCSKYLWDSMMQAAPCPA